MTKAIVQFNVPIDIEIDLEAFDEDSILEALCNELKNPNSTQAFAPTYDNLKEVIRAGYFEKESFEEMLSNHYFILSN